VSTQSVPNPPKGYKAAWTDDRLNPRRGQGTAEGWYDQDGVWTREIPARLVEDAARDQRKKRRLQAQQVTSEGSGAPGSGVGPDITTPPPVVPPVTEGQTRKRKLQVSSKSESAPAKATRSYVQVGTFGQQSNAEGASSRLAGLGLPVARQKISKGGKVLQIVYAGPFVSASEARSALTAARRAGFSDAFIR
jgi:cell division protein FtsN